MTIAICAVIPEGVVIGADSTSTRSSPDGGQRYLDNEQKIFEVGEEGTLGVVTWGLGQIGEISHRTRVAMLADDLGAKAGQNVKDVAARFAAQLWSDYEKTFRAEIDRCRAVIGDAKAPKSEQEKAMAILQNLSLGFCVAGRVPPDRTPQAYEINITSDLAASPAPVAMTGMRIWGANLFVYRALGMATNSAKDVIATGKWTGTTTELEKALAANATPIQFPMPLRETLDAVNCLLQLTVKLMKFTSLPPTCGGSVELATITTDRRFRWVRHKRLSAALSTGELHEQ